MTNHGAAENSVKRAEVVLNEAELLSAAEHWNLFDRFAGAIRQLASISRALRAEREISFYGDPESGIPPEELYSEDDAHEALGRARFVLEECRALLSV